MTQIFINGKPVRSTQPVQDVRGINILINAFPEVRPRHEVKAIVDFVYDCCQKCTGVIMFNNVIIQKKDIVKVEV